VCKWGRLNFESGFRENRYAAWFVMGKGKRDDEDLMQIEDSRCGLICVKRG
jgi:hypothetical protein